MDAKIVCQEYASSLEDLTFNSKPLINMLTMLAEENSQHAAEIIKLIEQRIFEVTIDKKLPSLYLMDSIVKNIGKEYLATVTQCIVALFTHVFEKGDEKVRMSLYKLRNTWPPVFPAKKLHEIDCSVHKLDPGWPVVDPPPTSPSIHINPKFLSKVEEKLEKPEVIPSTVEANVVKDFERKKEELEHLQEEQMRLQMQELTELQLKHDLTKKKQEQERQELIKQQKQRILQMRLREENIETVESCESSTQPSVVNSRDPRLEGNIVSKTTADDGTNVAQEKTEEKIKHVEVVKKPVEHVGFDSEFVPLDSNKDIVETPHDTAYNRDRPLGKKRYFKKDSTISDTEQTLSNKTTTKHKKSPETSRENIEGGKRRDGHQREKDSERFQKGRKQDDRKNRRREQENERKEKSLRGRDRESRPRGVGHRRNEMENRMRIGNRPLDNDSEYTESVRVKVGRHEDWKRGRFPKRSRRGHPGAGRGEVRDERDIRNRHEFPPPIENNGRLAPEHAPDHTLERGILGEPPNKKHRTTPPRPLLSEDEISEIRGIHRNSPPPHGPPHDFQHGPPHDFQPGPPHDFHPRQNPSERHEPGFDQVFRPRWRLDQQRGMVRPELFNERFPGDIRPPRFPHPEDIQRHERFPPQHFQPEQFHPNPHQVAGGVEIPLELTLDNESEIFKSAQRRLSTGDLSEEQHSELVEKLHQLYELQKWQRRHSSSHDHEAPLIPLHPPEGLRPHGNLPEPTAAHQAPLPNQPMEQPVLFEPPLPNRQFDFHPPPPTQMVVQDFHPAPPPDQVIPSNPDQPLNTIHDQSTAVKDEAPPSNLVIQKQTVDDLFKRLMDFGIITKVKQEASELPVRALTPPVVAITPPVVAITPPVVTQVQEVLIPEITLNLGDLRRRYDGVIVMLYRGTQCSSCGLRFKETDNENYRQHLDWHFRMNRKEKEMVAPHRNWFITEDDWLEFESSEDPKLKARSSVFEAESDHESENSEEGAERSCPVLREDTEAESACDICLEKFEQFWDETSEDWHYKGAVRIDDKTYHYLCYQDVGEAENIEEDTETPTEEGDTKNDDDSDEVSPDTHEDKQEDESDIKEPSLSNNKTSNVTDVVGGELGVNDTNKEEKKTECS